jgi:sugar phosphate isomerase/epimerase
MELALAPLTLHRPHPLEAIDAAAAAGYDLTGIQLALYGQPLSPLAHDPEFLSAARVALQRGGIAPLEVSNVVIDEEFRPETARAIVDFAQDVGARVVQAVCWDPVFDRAVEHLARTAEMAEGAGLLVAFEFMPYSATKTLVDAVELLGATGRDNLRLLLDSLHFFRSGGVVSDLAAVDPGLFGVIQLSDAPLAPPADGQLRPESTGNRLVPGTGELPLRELLGALPGGLPISLEVPCRAIAELSLPEQASFVLEGSRRFLEGAGL